MPFTYGAWIVFVDGKPEQHLVPIVSIESQPAPLWVGATTICGLPGSPFERFGRWELGRHCAGCRLAGSDAWAAMPPEFRDPTLTDPTPA